MATRSNRRVHRFHKWPTPPELCKSHVPFVSFVSVPTTVVAKLSIRTGEMHTLNTTFSKQYSYYKCPISTSADWIGWKEGPEGVPAPPQLHCQSIFWHKLLFFGVLLFIESDDLYWSTPVSDQANKSMNFAKTRHFYSVT